MLLKFEQNCMVQTTQKCWAFWQKKIKNQKKNNHFWQSIDAILEDVSVAETIVQY